MTLTAHLTNLYIYVIKILVKLRHQRMILYTITSAKIFLNDVTDDVTHYLRCFYISLDKFTQIYGYR